MKRVCRLGLVGVGNRAAKERFEGKSRHHTCRAVVKCKIPSTCRYGIYAGPRARMCVRVCVFVCVCMRVQVCVCLTCVQFFSPEEQLLNLPSHLSPRHVRNHVSSDWLQRIDAVSPSDLTQAPAGGLMSGHPTAATQHNAPA